MKSIFKKLRKAWAYMKFIEEQRMKAAERSCSAGPLM